VQAGLGYLSEDRRHFGLATGMDVAANITLPSLSPLAASRRLPRRGRHAACGVAEQHGRQTLRIEDADASTQTARLLSGGDQRRVVIAKWLVQRLPGADLDGPTRGIDVGAKSRDFTGQPLKDLAVAGARHRRHLLVSCPRCWQLSHRVLVMTRACRITGELRGDEATQENLHGPGHAARSRTRHRPQHHTAQPVHYGPHHTHHRTAPSTMPAASPEPTWTQRLRARPARSCWPLPA